jgi:hypothetical protein
METKQQERIKKLMASRKGYKKESHGWRNNNMRER